MIEEKRDSNGFDLNQFEFDSIQCRFDFSNLNDDAKYVVLCLWLSLMKKEMIEDILGWWRRKEGWDTVWFFERREICFSFLFNYFISDNNKLVFFLIKKLYRWRLTHATYVLTESKSQGAYELQKGVKLGGWKVVFFNRGPKLLRSQT